MLRWVFRRRSALGLIAVIITSALLAYYRVFAVPILLCPDEDSHVDYAFSLYSAGALLNVRTPPPSGWNTKHRPRKQQWERISHLYTLHLTDVGRMLPLLADAEKVPSDYGTKKYFDRIDDTAPRVPESSAGLTTSDNPALMSAYPFAYYALAAVEMGAVSRFTNSLVWMFFSARLLSIALLIVSLLLTYAILRQLNSRYALAITGIAGIFPLTTYVSSCIQPDNLSLTLVLLSWYLGLRAYKTPRKLILFYLALSLATLLVTKYYHYVFVAFPLLALLIAKHRLSPGTVAAMLLPSIALLSVQLWIGWGASIVAGHITIQWGGIFGRLPKALGEYYGGGYAYSSYWSTFFGWPTVPEYLKNILQIGTIIVFIAVLVGLAKRVTLLVTIASKRCARKALILALDPLVIGHILYLCFMIALYAITNNGFYAQGRHFFPFIVSGLYVVLTLAPIALPRRLRFKSRWALAAVLLIACTTAQYHAVVSLNWRYYPECRYAYAPPFIYPRAESDPANQGSCSSLDAGQ